MSRPQKARVGRVLIPEKTSFPSFFWTRSDRVLTSNVWAFLSTLSERELNARDDSEAQAYLEQAQEFFTASSSPRIRSKPLLYYYAFLNLSKVLLLHMGRRVSPTASHGLTETGLNLRDRVRLEGQRVQIFPRRKGRFNVAAELIHELGGGGNAARLRVVDVLSQLPSIHRTWVKAGDEKPRFCPARFFVLKDAADYWVRVCVDENDSDVAKTLPTVRRRRAFKKHLKWVESGSDHETWFESKAETGRKRGVDSAIRRLAEKMRSLGVSHLLTSDGYRYYLPAHEPRFRLPPLAASFVSMFYLGSITRYRPADYTKIFESHT